MSRASQGIAAVVTVLLLAAAGHAQQHAVQWPLQLETDAPAHRLTLTADVYAQITDPGLGDLEVLNAAGDPVPFGPVPPPAVPPAEPVQVPVPWFVLPPTPQGGTRDDTIRLRIERDAGGRLRRLDASVPESTPATVEIGRDLLLDLSALDVGAVEALQLDWARLGDMSARFRIDGSDDLVDWRVLTAQASLVDLQQGGHRLLRRDIDLPATRYRYLLLSRLDGGPALSPTAVSARLADPARPAADPFVWLDIDADAGGSAETGWTYRLPGPMRVEQIHVALGSANSVADVQLFSRDLQDAPWRPRGEGIAFRIDEGGSAIESDALQVHGVRDRQWRLLAEPRLDRAPVLRIGYAPDQFVLLSRGEGPYRLVAGSADARRPAYPVDRLLAEIDARRGSGWQLPEASLGPMQPFAGDAALVGALPWQRWLLWGVLLSGAALVIGMVLKLVRSSGHG